MDQIQPTIPPTQQIAPKQNLSYFKRLFEGRINRRNNIIGTFLLIIPFIFLFVILFIIFFFTLPDPTTTPITQPFTLPQFNPFVTALLSILNIIFLAICGFWGLSLQVRRQHDIHISGWLYLLNFVPIIGYLFILYTSFCPGTKGPNKYGDEPLPRTNIKQDILKL